MSSQTALRKALADARADSERKRVAYDLSKQAVRLLEDALVSLERLHSDDGSSKNGSRMQLATPPKSRRLKIAASSTQHESESKRLLLAAGKSDGDIAGELGVGRSTVRAWHSGDRAIPPRHADALLKKYGVPRSAWPEAPQLIP